MYGSYSYGHKARDESSSVVSESDEEDYIAATNNKMNKQNRFFQETDSENEREEEEEEVLSESDKEDYIAATNNKMNKQNRFFQENDSENEREEEKEEEDAEDPSDEEDSGQHSIDESTEDPDHELKSTTDDNSTSSETDSHSDSDPDFSISPRRDTSRSRISKKKPSNKKIIKESDGSVSSSESDTESARDSNALGKAVKFTLYSKANVKGKNASFDLTDSDDSEASNRSDAGHNGDPVFEKGANRSVKPTKNSDEETTAMPTSVKKDIGVVSVEQKRATLTGNIEQVMTQLAKSKMLLDTANIDSLPDKGDRLKLSIEMKETELKNLQTRLESLPESDGSESKFDTTDTSNQVPQARPKRLGVKALATQQREQTLTEDRIKDLHGSLNARPGEDERAEDPRGLKVNLMPHQQHALAWLLWREKRRPHGGILADDMGLGKTLTMISLILSTLESRDGNSSEQENDDVDEDDEWFQRKKSIRTKGGTLVVCPASILNQWDAEIQRRVKRGRLTVELFHGNSRETSAKRLAKNDVVLTTYNLIGRENKTDPDSILYRINWERVILDEAHVVRNHKSQASEAVCNLFARYRWALTGTPIQNKELDLFALLKFLKCSPFDDIVVWKRWVDNKNAQGHERLTTVMKTLMLRRTKKELQSKGGLGSLPDKNLEEIEIKLDPEEQLVYEKVLVFSRTLFAQFLHQRAEKQHMFELNAGKFNAPTFLQKPKDTEFTKAQNALLARHADVKASEILVLLLRLRQICCQPSLIHAMLDEEDNKENGVVDEEGLDPDVTSGLGTLALEDDENIDPNDTGVDRRVMENLLTAKNPVFKPNRRSSKIRAVLVTIEKILNKGDKIVIVSQWTSMLEIVRSHLDSIPGATYATLSGAVQVKNRQQIVDSFNKANGAPRILLLSLTAGGVGLNLVGGNHLLLLDVHWNPQLEAQAQDRIYRVGQEKSVYVYKFICRDTIEQRIKALQDHKLALAEGVLTGAGVTGASKLTLDDLKSLFSV